MYHNIYLSINKIDRTVCCIDHRVIEIAIRKVQKCVAKIGKVAALKDRIVEFGQHINSSFISYRDSRV